jgi:signal transduction histidine kinase
MAEIPFIVSARAGKLLGRENFSNPEGAIIELVKNSYDADAKNCLVIFDVPFKMVKGIDGKERKILLNDSSQIFIIDNGEGMTDTIIKDHWMKIGTGNKESEFLSADRRVKTGAKGIGRFAMDRLGFTAEMWTLPKGAKNASGFNWKMNWKQFDDSDKSIAEIMADLEPCKVTIDDILLYNLPPTEAIARYLNEVNFTEGTILKISGLKDDWYDDEIADVFKSLEALIPPKELNIPFQVTFHHIQREKEFGPVETAFFNDFDYKLTAHYNAKKLTVDFEIIRNELDTKVLRKNFSDLYNHARPPFDLDTIENKTFQYSKPVEKLLSWELNDANTKLLKELGSFSLTFYYLKFNVSLKEKYPFKSLNTKERKSVLEKFGGVKIYRDSFRVRPYGEPDNDWLKLGARVAQSPAGAGQRIGEWRVRPEQTAGIITISRNENPLLIDKSDRGSLQENDTYDLFRLFIIQVIHEFEVDRSRVLNVLYKYFEVQKKIERENEIQSRAEALAEQIIIERRNTESRLYGTDNRVDLFVEQKETEERKVYEEAFKNTFKAIEDEKIELANEELVQVRGLASLGLIMSSLAHELKEVRNNAAEIKSLEDIYKRLISQDERTLQDFNDGIDILDLLKTNAEKIKHWINYSLTAIKKDKRKRGRLDFSVYFESLRKIWRKIFKSKDIKLQIIDNTLDSSYAFRAFEMDMDTIFTNLINNSIDAFNNVDEVQERLITITIDLTPDDVLITYADNASGLSKVFKDPEEIFLPFTSAKKDRKGNDIGTGLGMYLVKNVVDDNNANINILSPQKGFAVSIAFPVRKN